MIRRKILLAVIVGIALVGVAVAALAIRSRYDAVTAPDSNAATAANSSAVPAQADQTKSTAEPSAADNAYRTANARIAPNGRSSRSYGNRTVYYNYDEQPRSRTFWQKHRDKLTVAGGVGAGALVGGLIGGKKGAGIGILSGGAGSALYTYKLRHKHNQ